MRALLISTPPVPDLPRITTTHPETAWAVAAAPLWLLVAAILLVAIVGRKPLSLLLQNVILRHVQRWRGEVDAGLYFAPQVVSPERLLLLTTIAVVAIILLLSQLTPLLLVTIAAIPTTFVLIRILIWWHAQRYIAAIDAGLPGVVNRLATFCGSASSFPQALDQVLADMGAGPLHDEWSFLKGGLGTPLATGRLALPHQVVGALIEQSPSERHRILLGHMYVALQQPHDILTRRLFAAGAALSESDMRRSEALTELSQMRYSGMAVGGAAFFMVLYLAATQWDRFVQAYTGIVGLVVGIIVVLAISAPMVGGILLSQAEDLDY